MKCESCQSEITFFMALRQALPHRFRCPRCDARYRVKAPRLGLIVTGIIAIFAVLVYQFALGMSVHGPSFIIPFLIVTVMIWLVFEFLLHRHITLNGQLIRLDAGTPEVPGEGARDSEAGPSGEGREDA